MLGPKNSSPNRNPDRKVWLEKKNRTHVPSDIGTENLYLESENKKCRVIFKESVSGPRTIR